jgi:hypothetical protein
VSDVPFRWNLARREQLGRLVEGAPAELGSIVRDLRDCCARVMAQAGDSRLMFVGPREAGERERFAAALAACPEMRHAWLRRLVLELRRG